MSRNTKQAVMLRRRDVERLYREGLGPSDILESLPEKHGKPSKKTIEVDIMAIRERWREQIRELFGPDRDVSEWWIQLALADRRAAIRAGDIKTANKIANDIAKLMGLDLKDMVIGFGGNVHDMVAKVCGIIATIVPPEVAEEVASRLEDLEDD